MIIWLASYPKSGNTWVRLFLSSLLHPKSELDINNIQINQFPNKKHYTNILDDFNDIKKIVKNCLNAQYFINLDNKVKILKTHSANWVSGNNVFTNSENTLGVIHIVRDPRNIITSIKNHFGKNSYDEALDFIKDEKKFIGSKDNEEEFDIPTLISSWDNHYKSWVKFKKNNLLIKYEDILHDPNKEFFKIIKFLNCITNFKFKDENIEKSILECNFENLKKQEEQKGFVEASKNKSKKFFNLGPKNNWNDILKKDIKEKIETIFKNEMKNLNYL